MGTDSRTCEQSVITNLGQFFHKGVFGMCHVTVQGGGGGLTIYI